MRFVRRCLVKLPPVVVVCFARCALEPRRRVLLHECSGASSEHSQEVVFTPHVDTRGRDDSLRVVGLADGIVREEGKTEDADEDAEEGAHPATVRDFCFVFGCGAAAAGPHCYACCMGILVPE